MTRAGGILVRVAAWAGVVGVALSQWSCGPELLLGAGDLEISPNPAQPGDAVTFVFRLSVVPEQDYTITAFIDSTVHLTEDRFEAIDGLQVLPVGTADELIAQYGLGTHGAYIEVHLAAGARKAGTAEKTFDLQPAPAPASRSGPGGS